MNHCLNTKFNGGVKCYRKEQVNASTHKLLSQPYVYILVFNQSKVVTHTAPKVVIHK